mgnify:CR=1 FL=1
MLDGLCSLATVAEDQNYVRPEVDGSGVIDIKDGRHPVIEKILPSGSFVQNDTYLDKNDNRLSIITGPNMAGKSTYMRQVALITLMAQIGSFVPASYARIGVVDKIFTRVGASDDLSMGQSTFMVEMMEVAQILKEATGNSLVILDEIGRGTSTYDGLSIAWAVAEYISDKEKCGAKTLFATHYHELTDLENKLEGVKNYSIAVKEKGEDIIFLRKIVKGGTDESYGVHVAKLAGVPQVVTKRANEILKSIERKNVLNNKKIEKQEKGVADGQLTMYNYKLAEIAHELDKIDVNELTPIDALNTLVKIKEKVLPVGRLDMYTSGALMLTNDGEFINKITHPSHEVEKTYTVTVKGIVTQDDVEKLKNGVEIPVDEKSEETFVTSPAKVKILKTDEEKNFSRLQITIHEGKNREVRKMCEAIGRKVLALHRRKIADLDVKNLEIGKWRYLTDNEVKRLLELDK